MLRIFGRILRRACIGTWCLAAFTGLILIFELAEQMPTPEGYAFLGGLLSGVVMIGTRAARFPGTFAHELTHAAASRLLGGRVHELWVSRDRGGHVVISHDNAFVALAPLPYHSLRW